MFDWTHVFQASSDYTGMRPNMWWYKRYSWPHLFARCLMLFSTVGYVFLPSAAVWANPVGEEVVGGSASFDRQGNTLTINQATERLAVNWQDFSIAAGETTHFNMPSAASIALNRVLGGNPSQIYGTLSSNGNIILVNNAGIFVGPGGVINAASFVGSTLDIDPQQFMNAGQGGYQLHGNSYAPIVNQGNITAEKGDVFLIAQKVENRGTLSAANGKASMVGAGERTEVVLHEVGGAGFAVRVTQLEGEHASGSNHNLPDGEELLNEGEIAAAQAELNASGNIYALAIKNTGTIRAKAVVAQADGTVRLDGGAGDVLNAGSLIAKNAGDISTAAGGKIEVTGQNVTASPESIITAAGGEQGGDGGKVKIDAAGTTTVQGQVDVAAPSANAKAGKVEILGERVGLFEGAKVDASGGAGGGTVLVGGDYLGGQAPRPEIKELAKQEAEPVKNAKATVMADTAEIRADATVSGDGGKVILWSDEYTGFYGQLFARGGLEGGDGGFIETSSAGNLQAFGSAAVLASGGQAGLWLLDPFDVTVVASGNSVPTFANPFTSTVASTSILNTQVSAALAGGATVTITTGSGGAEAGRINVNAAITGANGTLVLSAISDIFINNDVTLTVGGVKFVTSGGNININAPVAGTTSAILSASGGGININGTVTANSIEASSTQAMIINQNIFATAGAGNGTIQLVSGGGVSGTGLITSNPTGGLSILANGAVNIGTTAGPVGVDSGNFDITLFTTTGKITVGSVNGINGLSGGDISLTAPIIELGSAPVTAIGGEFKAKAATRVEFIAATDRFDPAVVTDLAQSYDGPVTLSADTVLRSSGDISFKNDIFGSNDFLIEINGNGALNLFGSVGSGTSLTSFRVEGGTVNLHSGEISTSGSTTFDGANLVLWSNTTLDSGKDLIILGTVNSSSADTPVTLEGTIGGNVILDGLVGGAAALGKVDLTATGQIAVNGGITTLPGDDPINTGADGSIKLTADNAVVLSGPIDTRGGLSAPTGVGGNLTIDSGGTDNKNIQIQSTINTRGGAMDFKDAVFFTGVSTLDTTAGNNSGTINFRGATDGSALATIRGGTSLVTFTGQVGVLSPLQLDLLSAGGVTFSSAAVFGATANITSYSGAVSFASVNKVNAGDLILDLGNHNLTFNGAVGNTNPFGLTVNSANEVTFNNPVQMGGDFVFNNLSGDFLAAGGATINSAANVNGIPHDLIINPVNSGATVTLRAVGTTSPLRAVTVGSGGGTTTLNGNIFTAGGAVSLGSPVSLDPGAAITIDTTRLGNSAGANISFQQTLGGSQALTLLGGTAGIIGFGGNVTTLTGLTVTSGASISVTDGSSVNIPGNIDITPVVRTPGTGLSLTTTGTGTIRLRNGVFLSADQNAAARGGNLTINGAGAVTIDGTIESRGGFAGGGFAGGTIDITGNGITLGTVDLTGGNGPASNTFGQGGNGGRLVLNSTGGGISAGNITLNGGDADSRATATGGDPGGDAGSISISGGTFTMRGSISANGGTGDNLGVGGRGGVLSLPAILLGAASTSITARGGANGTGQNGTGLDGSLTFTGTVNGTTADQNNLQLDVGSGNIKFEQAVGTTRLGNLRVLNAQNLAFDSTLSALTMVQLGSLPASGNAIPANSAGTTTFTGLVTLAGSGTVLDLRGYNFAFGAGLDTSGGKGSVNAEFNGVLTVGGAGLTLGGDMTLAGGGLAGTNPRVDLNFAGTAISTSSGALTFGTVANPLNVRLLANTTLSTGASGGQISFGGLLDSDATPRNLTLNSGGAVTLNGLVGSLSPLGSLTTDAGGSLVLAAVGSRANPSINATGLLTFNDQVDLRAATVLKANAVTLAGTGLIDGANDLLVLLPVSAGAGTLLTLSGQVGQATPLTGLRVEGGVGTTLGFAGTQANPSVNTTGNQYYGSAVTLGAATVLNAGSLDFLSTINGANSLLLNSPGAINLYGKVGDTGGGLTQFQTTGGGALNLLATGATSGSPSIRTTGAQLFGSSLVLGEDTILRSTGTGDFIFLNTIDSRLANQPRAFEVIGNAKMVLEAAAGATTRLKSATLTGTGDVTVLAGINTFGGAINLESTSGAVVLGGNTDSGVADQLGGAVNLKSATQVLLNGGVITTFGGAVAFNDGALGTSFIQTASTIITAGGTSGGSITFNNDLNGSAGLTLTAGRGALNFDAIGTTNPLGLTVNSSGAVTLNEAVRLGGDFVFNDLSGNFNAAALATIDSAVDAFGNPHGLFINPVNSTATVNLQAIGATSPLGAVVVGSGGGTTTLNGNILTAGGGVSIGSPLILPNGLVVDTTRLGRTGGGVTFLGSVDTDGAGDDDISITAGTGAVTFAGAVGATRKPRDLTVNSGGSISFTDVANLNVARDILVIPQASSVNDMTLTAGRNIEFRQGITARPNNGPGRNLTATADNGTLTIGGSINVAGRSGTFIGFAPDGSTFTFATAGAKGGTVTLQAQSITTGVINANGSDNFVTGGNGGDGGSVVLTSKNDLITGPINVSGGTDGDLGGVGGTINLVRSEASGNVRVGTLSSVGGASNKGVGAAGGSITVSATLGDLVAPTDFLTQGGSGSGGFVAGQGGTVTLRATAGSLSFANSTLNLAGDGGLTITAGKHLILATVADVTTPSLSTGGVVFTLNTGAPRLDRRGGVTLEYGSANNGGTFFMPASSYVVSNGGDIRVDVRDIAGGQDAGAMTISGFSTSGDNVNGGRILLNSNPGAGGLGAVTVLGALETLGGTPTTPTYGRAGGSIFIAGTTVSVGSINTAGSSSLATATTPAFGGSGGDIEIRGDTGITLRRNLVTTGGTGQGVGDANGGGGGGISLKGDVTLNSGDSQNTIIILNTQGGGLAAQGSYGLGGSITATGKITGTTSTSNTLDLRYGSGTATLGDAAADTITLGTLITAADDPRSTGSLVINGKLVVDNMITYARGYSLSIFGAGTQFSTLYTFLNTGTVGLGAAGAGVTFVGGFNSTAGAATRLNGIVNTGSAQSLDNGGNMAMGAVILAADSTLNSNGNNITLTTIDNDPGVSGAKDLTFAGGIGSTGVVTISGAVGSLNPVDVVTVNSAGPVTFASSFNGGAIVTAAGTTTTFRGGTSVTGPLNGITTTGASSLGGTVSLVNSLYASDTTQVFTLTSSAGTFDMPGTVTMSGGPFALAGPGAFTVAGTLSGSQTTLTLSGAGGKTFSGSLTAGNGTTAITATGGAVTFGGIATLSGASTFAMAPTLAGGTITASGLTTMDAGLSLGGAGTLGGAGSYQINGNISGAGQRLTLSGAGQKTITGTTTVGGITQNSGSGQASFGSSVTTSSTSDFFGAVVLRGTTFTAGGATSYNTLSLQAGDVILAGNFAYTVSGAVTGNADGTRRNLTLNGNQAKTFNGALSGIETLAIGGGSLISSGGLEANTLTQNGNAMTLGGSVNVANALNLDGATSLNSGTTLTAASGMNISAGSFASNGNARLAGGTVTIGIGTLTSNAGTLTVAPGVQMGTAVTLAGPGNYAFLGNLGSTGADRNLTLGGALTSFAGTLTGVNNLTGNGAVSFGNNVTTSGSVAMNGVTTTSANVTISSGGNNQTFARAVTLGGNLTSQTTSTASFGGGVSGVGNLTVNGAGSVDIGAGIENRGTFLLTRAGAINLGLGDLTASEVGLIRSSEGATFEATGGSSAAASGITANTGMTLRSTAGSASASSVVANTGLTLDGATGATIAGTTVNGDLNMTTLSVANFNASLSSARSLGIQAASISSGGQAGVLANISVPVLGGITLTGGGLDYQPAGNLTTTGRIATSGDVVLAPSGNFVNSFRGNPFTAPSVKILTQDFFSYPASAGVPGLANVFGVSSVAQLGANQIGVAKGLLAGSAGPYITEFTTGTGQPYILATQNNAVPPVMLPMALPSAGTAFASRVTFTQDELEMMTPEERSAFEAGRRQQAARVMLQREGGLSEEIGTPAEGQIPQAKAPEPAQPAPTAQVLLDGKPLASTSEKDRGDASRLLRIRPMRAVVLRGDSESQRLMESERIAAEVTLGSIPVAGNR